MKKNILLCLLALLAFSAFAQSGTLAAIPAILPDDPTTYLGMGLAEAYERFGPPARVSSLRGEAAWQDDVVFSFGSAYALYWTGDRLWQLRFSSGYSGSVFGVFLGDGAEKVISLLGTPYFRGDSDLVFRLANRSYPVRLRVSLSGDKVSDIYVYRADY